MPPSSVPMITASTYSGINDRGTNVASVKKELDTIISSQPTQIHPDERTRLLDALLADLEERDGAPWAAWPEELHTLALTAIKTLGRNPIGSETLLSTSHLRTLYFHSGLPFHSSAPASLLSPAPHSPPALEALKVLANLLLLHAAGRDCFSKAGGAEAVARALAGKDAAGNLIEIVEDKESERIFLLGRLGFLVTLQRREAVRAMVDTEDLVESMVYHLVSLRVVEPNYMALTEVLKLANNVLQFYPIDVPSTASSRVASAGDNDWNSRFDPLLYPILCLYHTLPSRTLAPPLSTCLHTFFAIPFSSHLLPVWTLIPEPASPRTSSSSPYSSVRGLISDLARATVSATSRRSLDADSDAQASRRSESPSLPDSPDIRPSKTRKYSLPPSRQDATAFPQKTLDVLEDVLDAYLPYPTKPDDELLQGLDLDETLAPVLALLGKAGAGCEEMRAYMRERLLPADLDRSSDAGSLESRPGMLGSLLRLMQCSTHPACCDTAGELLWNLCTADAALLSHEIGYGNAAGLLFQKGISQPPPAHITEMPTASSKPDVAPARSAHLRESERRNPITSIVPAADTSSPADGMTAEEREREAERLFVLFDRMEKNPVISARSGEGPEEKQVSVKEAVRRKMEGMDEAKWEADERRAAEEEDRRDEEEALRDLEAYRKRREGR